MSMFALLLLLLGILVMVILAFFFQFAIWELLISRKGPIESLKASYQTVKKNMKKTLVFDLACLAGGIGLSFVYSALQALVQLIGSLFMMISPIVGLILFIGLYCIVIIIETALSAATLRVFTYMFWRKISG
jgi:uncharacterized membrane protein